MTQELVIVVLAAGRGKRMQSNRPKVCHLLAGKPMLQRVIETAKGLRPKKIYVIYRDPNVQKLCHDSSLHWIMQAEPLGTAHAVACIKPYVTPTDRLLVLFGDVPLITLKTLRHLLEVTQPLGLGLVVAQLPNPFGFGRIIRDETNRVQAIVEEKDATETQQAIKEIFSGIITMSAECFFNWWPKIKKANKQQEYYLTDSVALAREMHTAIDTIEASDSGEIFGINTRSQLATAERWYQRQQVHYWMEQGVSFLDPARVDLRGEIKIGQDTVIDVDVVLEDTIIGARSQVGPFTCIYRSILADNVLVRSHTVIEGAQVAAGCQIGPYARIRPETVLESEVRVGNFVEIKKTHIGAHTKVNHLSYLGDALIGQHVNVGAGVITVNYDGIKKQQTIIEDHAFIGCDSQLIAPVHIGANAFIGAGSTITKPAPANTLVLSRSKQKSVPHWRRPVKPTA